MPPRTTLRPTVREIAGGMISLPGTQGFASSPGDDGLIVEEIGYLAFGNTKSECL